MTAGEATVGEVIGGYRLEALLGTGSTSRVFLGQHLKLGRQAAIKVVSLSVLNHPDVSDRLLQEAQAVNNIRHPNIVDIWDFVEIDDPRRVALIMEYIEGPSLADVRQYRLSMVQALGLAEQLVEAVAAAHAAGVIHRDLKPDNLLLMDDPRGDASQVPALKVVDFGLAKLLGPGGVKTMAGAMLGTPAYMAPEQIAGRPPPSAATDVFAVAELIYELFSGSRAYAPSGLRDILKLKLRGEVPDLNLDAPLDISLLPNLRKCLAPDPADRPSLSEIRQALQRVAVGLEQASRNPSRGRRAGSSDPSALESGGSLVDTDEAAMPTKPHRAVSRPAKVRPRRSRALIPPQETAAGEASEYAGKNASPLTDPSRAIEEEPTSESSLADLVSAHQESAEEEASKATMLAIEAPTIGGMGGAPTIPHQETVVGEMSEEVDDEGAQTIAVSAVSSSASELEVAGFRDSGTVLDDSEAMTAPSLDALPELAPLESDPDGSNVYTLPPAGALSDGLNAAAALPHYESSIELSVVVESEILESDPSEEGFEDPARTPTMGPPVAWARSNESQMSVIKPKEMEAAAAKVSQHGGLPSDSMLELPEPPTRKSSGIYIWAGVLLVCAIVLTVAALVLTLRS